MVFYLFADALLRMVLLGLLFVFICLFLDVDVTG